MYEVYHTRQKRTLLVITDKGTRYAFEIARWSYATAYRKVREVFLHERGEGPNLTEWPYDLENTLQKYPDMKKVPFHVKADRTDSNP